jgi:hypothetical protein
MRVLAAASLMFALPLLAATPRIEPMFPDSSTPFTVSFFYFVCGEPQTKVTVTPGDIDIEVGLAPGSWACITEVPPFEGRVKVGPVPAGTYRLHIESNRSYETTLVVRDANGIFLAPFAVPIGSSPRPVTLVRNDGSSFLDYDGMAIVGGQRVAFRTGRSTLAGLDVPSSSRPGAVDVDVSVGEEHWLERSALAYYDPSQPPDRSIAEPLLFPIAYDGPGAYGSQWKTDNSILPGNWASLYASPCDGCTNNGLKLPPMSRADGLVVWFVRGAWKLGATSLLREVSHPDSAPIPVPVVRERDFVTSHVLGPIPVDPKYRVTLRVWSLEPTSFFTSATSPTNSLRTQRSSPKGLPFLMVDLTDSLAKRPHPDGTAYCSIGTYESILGFWPMITVTNDETQQVTILAPQ